MSSISDKLVTGITIFTLGLAVTGIKPTIAATFDVNFTTHRFIPGTFSNPGEPVTLTGKFSYDDQSPVPEFSTTIGNLKFNAYQPFDLEFNFESTLFTENGGHARGDYRSYPSDKYPPLVIVAQQGSDRYHSLDWWYPIVPVSPSDFLMHTLFGFSAASFRQDLKSYFVYEFDGSYGSQGVWASEVKYSYTKRPTSVPEPSLITALLSLSMSALVLKKQR